MLYSIAALTHKGTARHINQDRVLVNTTLLSGGFLSYNDLEVCRCLVADGVGGGVAGEVASQFILEEIIADIDLSTWHTADELKAYLELINQKFLAFEQAHPEVLGAASTLVGILLDEEKFQLVNAGDSQAWLMREDRFFQLNENQVFDASQKGSPITSYFGGKQASLTLDFSTSLRSVQAGDCFVMASDGLFGALEQSQIKTVLLQKTSLLEKAETLLKQSLTAGADDNVSAILIEAIE